MIVNKKTKIIKLTDPNGPGDQIYTEYAALINEDEYLLFASNHPASEWPCIISDQIMGYAGDFGVVVSEPKESYDDIKNTFEGHFLCEPDNVDKFVTEDDIEILFV